MFTIHNFCRACHYAKPSGPPGMKSSPSGEKLVEVFDLGLQALANDFCDDADEHAGFAPLKVMFCPRCKLAQLSVVVNPATLYAKYNYVTSNSNTMFAHFKLLWDCINERHGNPVNVLEIGSNDGTLLNYLKENGAESVVGIDPAENLTTEANNRGVRSICGLFDKDTAGILSTAMPRVDVVIARHVFCHVDDWQAFVRNLDLICQKDTLIAIEVPYVMDLLRLLQFDTIYHEHLSYLNITAVDKLLEGTPFKLDHIQHFNIHGGAIALYIRRRDYEGLADDSVAWYLDNEAKNLNVEAWSLFEGKVRSNIAELKNFVGTLSKSGSTVCGFGASAKSTVWVNACGFTRKELKFITDTTPQKQWKFSPGSNIPIVDEGALLRELPSYAVLFSWNYKNEILEKNRLFIEKGGKFIVPIPTVQTVP